jgi:MYXO-CTERM domain-containing protein
MKPLRAWHFSGPALLATALGAGSARAEWIELGPAPLGGTNGNGGRVTAIAAHPTDNNLFYIGAATGGVWKNQNGMWTPLTDRMPFAAIGGLAIDPNNGNTLYAGTGEPNSCYHCFYGVGIYKSTDAGATWTQIAANTFGGRAFSRIVVSPMNGQVLYASIMVTGDAVGVGAKGHPLAKGPVGVFRSADGGATWAALAGGLPAVDASDVAMAPDDPNTLYAAIAGHNANPANGVYKSTNGGDTWTKLSGGLPPSPGRIGLAVAPSNAMRIYALIAQPDDATGSGSATLGIYTSSNGGTSWTATPGVANFMGDQGVYDNVAIVDPRNPDIAFFGGVNIRKTANGGMTITDVTATHVDNHAFAFTAGGDLLVGEDGGLNRSTGGTGMNWARMDQGLGINQLYAGVSTHPMDAEFVLGGFQDNGSNLRSAGGTWRSVLGADGGPTAIIQSAPNIQFATIYDATSLYRSTNGGQSFPRSAGGIVAGDRTAFYHVTVPNPADPQVVFTVTHRVYKSTNQGASWTPLSADLTGGGANAIRALAIAQTGQILWAATTDNRIMMSQDGGQNFTKMLDVPGGWQRVTRELAVAPWDDKVAYVAVQRFGTDQVRMTMDLGATWTAMDGNLPDIPANAVDAAVVQGQRMVFVGTDGGVFYTCNDGVKWVRLGQALPNTVVVDVRYDSAFKRIVASTMGRGVWSIEEPAPATCDSDAGIGTGGAGGAGGASGAGIDGGATGGGPTGAGGQGGAVGSGGGEPTGSGGAVGAGGIGVGAGAATTVGGSTTGPQGGPGPSSGQDTGCGCRVTGRADGAAVSLSVLGLALALRRRRQSRPDQNPQT